jgi:hypothetical protein
MRTSPRSPPIGSIDRRSAADRAAFRPPVGISSSSRWAGDAIGAFVSDGSEAPAAAGFATISPGIRTQQDSRYSGLEAP